MKNNHLVPVNIIDIVERLTNKSIQENEKANLLLRLEAVRDYCTIAINKNNNKSNVITRQFR